MAAVKTRTLLALDGVEDHSRADDAYEFSLELIWTTLSSVEVCIQVDQRL
jgi:hypothetical protein